MGSVLRVARHKLEQNEPTSQFAIKPLCLWPAAAYPCLPMRMFHLMLQTMLELMWQIMWADFCPEGMLETTLEFMPPAARQQRKEGNGNPGA